jgi:hypothetical protein
MPETFARCSSCAFNPGSSRKLRATFFCSVFIVFTRVFHASVITHEKFLLSRTARVDTSRDVQRNRVHRNFKLPPDLNAKLVKEAAKTHRTQTAILELALAEWFRIKRSVRP